MKNILEIFITRSFHGDCSFHFGVDSGPLMALDTRVVRRHYCRRLGTVYTQQPACHPCHRAESNGEPNNNISNSMKTFLQVICIIKVDLPTHLCHLLALHEKKDGMENTGNINFSWDKLLGND